MKALKAVLAIPIVIAACLVGFCRDDLPDLWRELRNR